MDLFRRADDKLVRNRQDEGLLDGIVRQRDYATSAFQKLKRLSVPAVRHFQNVSELVASSGQLFDAFLI
jgi:hypothetical protein